MDADGCGLLFVFRADIAGGENDRNVRADREDLSGYLETGDPRHREVGDDSGEAIRIRAKFSDSRDGVDVSGDTVAEPFEEASTEQDERFFVVDEEEAFVVGGFVNWLRDNRSGIRL